MRVLIALAALLGLAACAQPPMPSESYYNRGEMMAAHSAQMCRVIDARPVMLNAQATQQNSGYGGYGGGYGGGFGGGYGGGANTGSQSTGGGLGAVIGAAIGNNVSNATGAPILGALVGGYIGSQAGAAYDAHSPRNRGMEYSIVHDGQQSVLVQGMNPGDRILRPGDDCRLVGSGVGQRVLAANHIPSSIAAPRTIRFH